MEHTLLQENSVADLHSHDKNAPGNCVRRRAGTSTAGQPGAQRPERRVGRRNDTVQNNKTPLEKGEHHRHSAGSGSQAAASREP